METDFIVGCDEVGTGAFAGPFCVGAAVVPVGWTLEGLNDSKKLTPKKRVKLYDEIRGCYPFVRTFIEWVWPEEIDREGLGKSVVLAFRRVVLAALKVAPNARVILDGDLKLYNIEHESYPKADGTFPAVMAASVFAKVERDRWMETEADAEFGEYLFWKNKGYGTPDHIRALDEHGPCRLHRMSYEPVFTRAGVVASESSVDSPRRK